MKIRPACALLVGASVALAACSLPTRPLWWPGSSSPKAVHGSPASRTPPACARQLPRVGAFQAGIGVYWDNGTLSGPVVQARSVAVIRYALSLHANSLMVSFPFFTASARSSAVFGRPRWTPTATQLDILLGLARQCHLAMTVRPLLSETNLKPGGWRGSIQPTSLSRWFRHYQQFLQPYLRSAQSFHVQAFVIGTELNSLRGYRNLWSGLARQAAATYKGLLAYDGRFHYHFTRTPVAVQTDLYPSLSVPASASQQALDTAWRRALNGRYDDLRGVVVAELGMAAVPDAYRHPASWFGIGSPTEAGRIAQARWFAAACQATLRAHVRGIYWWEVNFNDLDSAHGGDQFSFYDTPAQEAVRACFSRQLR